MQSFLPFAGSKSNQITITGVLQILAGGFLFVFFGTSALISKFWSLFAGSSGRFSLVLLLIAIAGCVFLIWKGTDNIKIAYRFRQVSRSIGNDTNIDFYVLEQKLSWNRDQLQKNLRRQMDRGFWPDAYLDTDKGFLRLGYAPPSPLAASGNQAADELINTANGFIHEMFTISHSIPDPALKAQVEHLTDIAKQIYAYVQKNPGKTRQVRQFSNYYLPITVDLLKNYQELQSQVVKGENILDSIQSITGGMTIVETAFKKQLDDLYKDKTLDISVDIEVLQQMVNDQGSFK
ncbi:MAG: 5-bromo-4-chloroindolyl phosphate hydrolysis family protein [Clostridiales bacterium]|nr:5-bromo-4-chloroindolyl phosphate hydrolysis family protein [Clostridiales bacterium]